MKRFLVFLLCLFFVSSIISFASLSAIAKEKIVFDIGSTDPEGSYQVQAIRHFADLVEQKTEGMIQIDIYPSGQLGTQSEEHQAFVTGSIKIGVFDPASLSQIYPDVAVFNFPYLFKSAEHAFQVLDPESSEVMKEISTKLLEKRNIRILGGIFWRGFRQLTTKNFPVYKPEDLKGKKIRAIENKIWVTMVEGMGAIATPIDFTEVPTALMTGIVDGQENPLTTIYDNSLYPPVQNYLMLTNHLGAAMLLAIREEAWVELDPEYQEAINEAIDETAAWSIEEIARRDAEILEKLEEKGMNIISKDDGLDVDAFRTQVIDYAKGEFPEWVDYINRIN